jgi:SAM-dependent methyltransferase
VIDGKNSCGIDWLQARFLEVGAYRHYNIHLLSSERGAECVLTDISAAALRDGRVYAEAHGVKSAAKLVVADFHDFPFSDRYFDIGFIASAVHHTRHPEKVLREIFRVLKPGGLLLIDNEPCARACCFHGFVSNRSESFTPFEAQLHADGLLPTLSSPFWGARPELLFGMVEKDRIPFTLYQSVFEAEGKVLSRSIANHSLVGPFERQLLQLVDAG